MEPLAKLIGTGRRVPCVDGVERVGVELDQAASTQAHPDAAARVEELLPWYSSVHRGAGFRSRFATAAYEQARRAVLAFAGRPADGDDTAIICRNTTEAINHLAYRLDLERDDVVVTTVVEHHANLLPWGRVAERRYVECTSDGIFTLDQCDRSTRPGPRRPALLAVTGASNVTGWLPPIDAIIEAAHERSIQVVVDAAQLAPHRPLPATADFIAFSGHKLYAPFGSGALIGPTAVFETGDPFLAGGGAVDLVGLNEVIWTAPPDREEAGSPNVIGAVAMHAAIDALDGRRLGGHRRPREGTRRSARRRPARHRRGAPSRPPGATHWGVPERAERSRPFRWLRSRSRGCTTPWWRRGSVPSTGSPSGTAASAPIPTWCAFSACPTNRW